MSTPKPYPIAEETIRLNPDCGCTRSNPATSETLWGVFVIGPESTLKNPWKGKVLAGLFASNTSASAFYRETKADGIFKTTDPETIKLWIHAALVGNLPTDLELKPRRRFARTERTIGNPSKIVKSRRGSKRYSKLGREFVSKEISHQVTDKGMPVKQAVRAAHEIARKKGIKVPPAPEIPVSDEQEPEASEEIEEAFCPMWGELNTPMGVLGRLAHYRCRACGMMYNRQIPRRNPAPVKVEVSALGRCVEMLYHDAATKKDWIIKFPPEGPREVMLAQTARKRLCLFYQRRRVNMPPRSFDQVHINNYREFNGKDVDKVFTGHVPVLFDGSRRAGELREIVYWSDKVIDPESAKAPGNYHHTFKSPFPFLFINPRNQLVVEGGGYTITRRGIEN